MWNNQLQTSANWAGNGKTQSNVNSNTLTVSSIFTNFISSGIAQISSIYTNYISSGNAQISYLSVGQLNVSSIINFPEFNASDWSLYPALSNVDMANYNLNRVNRISSSQISTNILNASFANIPFVKTSTLEFEIGLGRDIAISSLVTNTTFYRTNEDNADPGMFFLDSTLTTVYGAIINTSNNSTLNVASVNDLGLIGQSSIQMLGFKAITLNTIRDPLEPSYIQLVTDGVIIDTDLIFTQAAISTNSIRADSIDTRVIRADTYLNLPSSFVSEWSLYPAVSTVRAELGLFNQPQYDIKDFRNINGNTINGKVYYSPLAPTVPIGGTVNADISVNAPLGAFTNAVANNGFFDKVEVGSILDKTGEINLYGSDLIAGDNALYVEGGTTLSGGGLIHGVSIGAQTVGGINLQRIDVLPIGIDIVSDTFITIDSAAAANIATGGALSLAGGSYIEYNTDQNYFINTSAGNDFTDIYVGNIHAADGGTDQLRINDTRGVKLSNVTEINLQQNVIGSYNSNTLYSENIIVDYIGSKYVSLLSNRNVNPTSTIGVFNSTLGYNIGNYVRSTNTVSWNCISTINVPYTRSTPSIFLSSVWTPYIGVSTVNQIWGSYTLPGVSKIVGDNDSYINIGKISTLTTSTNELYSKLIYTDAIYTTVLGQTNSLVPTSILVNNGMDLQQNNISNVNTLTTSNISTNNLSTGNIISGSININNISTGLIRVNAISTNNLSTGSITSESININNISTGLIRVNAISTNNISSGFIFSGLISSLTFNTSTINTNTINGVNNILTLNGFVSSQSIRTSTLVSSNIFTSSIIATAINTNTGTAGVFNSAFDYVSTASVRTNTLQSATGSGTVITFSFQPINNVQALGTQGNGGYSNAFLSNVIASNISTVSTTTNVLNASTIRTINESTQSLVVSTINFKTYPYTSTLNVFPSGVSTFLCDGNIATTPQILSSNITFPALGNYLVTSKLTVSKATGGAGAEPYGSLCLSRGRFPSTFATQDGFNAIPYLNAVNKSTFNTYTTSVSVTDNTQLTRFLTYYDTTGHNYTINMAISDIRIRYFPGSGNLPDIGIS